MKWTLIVITAVVLMVTAIGGCAAPKQQEGMNQPEATPTAGKEWPTKGEWTIGTSRGILTVIYRETDSAKGKFRLWMDESKKILYTQNLLDKPIYFVVFTKADGEITISNHVDFDAKEKSSVDYSHGPNNMPEGGVMEIWVEIE